MAALRIEFFSSFNIFEPSGGVMISDYEYSIVEH